eukprot:GEMP01020511.1.p1 GENE.GEMP01020511.1~~GEMP01020511.1.p1  ORF type:complete len:167 (+),score=7.58 GEMP01020511.1:110-610(+)
METPECLRILIISDYSPVERNGISIHFSNLICALERQGHSVVIYSPRSSGNSTGLSVTNPYNTENRLSVTPSWKLIQALRREHWDVVHIVFPIIIALPLLAICKSRKIPVYCSHHCDLQAYNKKYSHPLFQRVLSEGYNLCIRVPSFLLGTVNTAPSKASIDKYAS